MAMGTGFGAGWRQVVACMLMMASGAMVTSAFSVMAVPYSEEFHPSRTVLMLTLTTMSLVAGLLSPMLGNLMDRWSLQLMMGTGVVMTVAGFVALSFATQFVHVLAIYGLLLAPGNVLIGPMPATVLLSRWFVKRRGTALGMAIAGVSIGGFVFPPLTQLLLDNFHWREAFRVLALIVALLLIPAVMFLVNRPSEKGLYADGAPEAPETSSVGAAQTGMPIRELLLDPAFWIFGIILASVFAGMMGMVTSLVPLAVGEGIDKGAAALLISIYSACGFLAKLIFAGIADNLKPRYLLFIAIAGFAAGMACMIGAEGGYWLIALGVGLTGLFGGFMMPLQGLLVPLIFGQAVVGRVSGVISLIILVAFISTPPLFGFVYDVTGNYDGAFLVFIALAGGIALLVPYLRLQPKDAGKPPLREQPA